MDKNLLENIASEYDILCTQLGYEEVFLDKKLYLSLDKKKRIIEPIALSFKEYLSCKEDIDVLQKLLDESGDVEIEKVYIEYQKRLENIEAKLKNLILTMGAKMDKVCLEIIPLGGSKISSIIIDGVSKYCEKHHIECVEDLDGNRKVLRVCGLNSKKVFENICGLHSESMGDGCQVFLYDDIEVPKINDSDIIIEAFRSSGAGGQHINTTDSAIRAIHQPTGISVICQNERSQLQNKTKALENLKDKVNKYFENQIESSILSERKRQLKNMKIPKRIYNIESGQIFEGKNIIWLKDFENGDIL